MVDEDIKTFRLVEKLYILGVIIAFAALFVVLSEGLFFFPSFQELQGRTAVAGVNFEQNSSHITVTVVAMDRANTVYVNESNGSNKAELNSVGESVSFRHNGTGSEYVAVGSYNGKRNVFSTYTVE